MPDKNDATSSPSELAMERFIAQAPGLQQPQLAVPMPGSPDAAGLEEARAGSPGRGPCRDRPVGRRHRRCRPAALRRTSRHGSKRRAIEIVAEGCVGASPHHRRRIRLPRQLPAAVPGGDGCPGRRAGGSRSTPVRTIQTVSGRTAIDLVFRGLMARADAGKAGKTGKRALIFDTLEWSGYRPLARALDLEMVHAPAIPKHGLSSSAEGLRGRARLRPRPGADSDRGSADPAEQPHRRGHGAKRARPLRGDRGCKADLPVMIDAFYSPLVPTGHADGRAPRLPGEGAGARGAGLSGRPGGRDQGHQLAEQDRHNDLDGPERPRRDRQHHHRGRADPHARHQRLPAAAGCAGRLRPPHLPGRRARRHGPALHGARRDPEGDACSMRCQYDLPLAIGGSFYGTAALVDKDVARV